ncbi:hypothetical protein FEI13_08260 [Halomonas urmiana]|uniref:Uncharacterized protein n=1 Tax=Halomonas urmiana TaxID=490901 RepID=A0A5R8MIB6_9GAMM|nr:hypothetical protein [Halomonas urmiana]TLF51650.1 hypothetical protein FEI13_08260 [Halomonas urmiana]
MTLEDQLQQNIVEHLTHSGLDRSLPSFNETEAIDFLTAAIQFDGTQYDYTDTREIAFIFKAMIDFVRARRHGEIAFYRNHMY